MGVLRIILTGVGAPGIKGTYFSLKNNFDSREVFILGTDVNDSVVGKYLCDNFKVVPLAVNAKEYLDAMLKLCDEFKINVLIPQNTAELLLLSENKALFEALGTKVLVSNQKSIECTNNKYEFLKMCRNISLPVPEFYLANNISDLTKYAELLGWPQKRVVVKPPISNGSRGVRIIDENINLKNAFYNEKPSSLITKMTTLISILGTEFPDLIVSEYLPGTEYTVDSLRTNSLNIAIPRKRDLIRSGITFNGSLEKHNDIILQSTKISEAANLEFCFGFQFKESCEGVHKVLECNPRIQGTMVLSTIAGANLIYGAIKYLIGEGSSSFEIDWNAQLLRYWGGIGLSNNKVIIM